MKNNCENGNVNLDNLTKKTESMAETVQKRGMLNTMFAFNIILTSVCFLGMMGIIAKGYMYIEKQQNVLITMQQQQQNIVDEIKNIRTVMQEEKEEIKSGIYKNLQSFEVYDAESGKIQKWTVKKR